MAYSNPVTRRSAVLAACAGAFALCSCAPAGNGGRSSQQAVDLADPYASDSGASADYLAFDDTRTNFGVYLQASEEARGLEVMPPVLGWFESWYAELSREKLALCGTGHLAVPLITWQPADVPLEEIAAGAHDSYIADYFDQLARACPSNDIIMRFAHEMETRDIDDSTWYSWQGLDFNLYKTVWRRVLELGNEHCPNVKWLWSPNHSDAYSAQYYPGDDYVDYIGITLNMPLSKTSQYTDFADYYARKGVGDHLERYGKKAFIAEVAYPSDDPDAKVAYLRSIVDFVQGNPVLCGAMFFNDDKDDNRRYRVTDNDAFMDVIYEGISENEA